MSAKARKKQRECHLEKNQYHYIFYFPNNPYLVPAGNLFAAKLILEIVGPQTTKSGVQGSNPASLTVENSVYTELYTLYSGDFFSASESGLTGLRSDLSV